MNDQEVLALRKRLREMAPGFPAVKLTGSNLESLLTALETPKSAGVSQPAFLNGAEELDSAEVDALATNVSRVVASLSSLQVDLKILASMDGTCFGMLAMLAELEERHPDHRESWHQVLSQFGCKFRLRDLSTMGDRTSRDSAIANAYRKAEKLRVTLDLARLLRSYEDIPLAERDASFHHYLQRTKVDSAVLALHDSMMASFIKSTTND